MANILTDALEGLKLSSSLAPDKTADDLIQQQEQQEAVASLLSPEEVMGFPDWQEFDPAQRSAVVDNWSEDFGQYVETDEEREQLDQAIDRFRATAGQTTIGEDAAAGASFVGGAIKSGLQSFVSAFTAVPRVLASTLRAGAGEQDTNLRATVDTAVDQLENLYDFKEARLGLSHRAHDSLVSRVDELGNKILNRETPKGGEDLLNFLKEEDLAIADLARNFHGDEDFETQIPGETFDYRDIPEGDTDELNNPNRLRSITGHPRNMSLLLKFSATRNPEYLDALKAQLVMSPRNVENGVKREASSGRLQRDTDLGTKLNDLLFTDNTAAELNEISKSFSSNPVEMASLLGAGGAGVQAKSFLRGSVEGAAIEGAQGAFSAIADDFAASGSEVAEAAAAEAVAGAGIATLTRGANIGTNALAEQFAPTPAVERGVVQEAAPALTQTEPAETVAETVAEVKVAADPLAEVAAGVQQGVAPPIEQINKQVEEISDIDTRSIGEQRKARLDAIDLDNGESFLTPEEVTNRVQELEAIDDRTETEEQMLSQLRDFAGVVAPAAPAVQVAADTAAATDTATPVAQEPTANGQSNGQTDPQVSAKPANTGLPASLNFALDRVSQATGGTASLFVPKTNEAVSPLIKRFEELTGRKAVGFKVEGGQREINGVVATNDPNTVYYNADSTQPLEHVLKHELAHTLESLPGYSDVQNLIIGQNPELFESFKQANPQVSPNQQRSEFVADVAGSVPLVETLHNLRRNAPVRVVRQAIAKLRNLLNQILGRIPERGARELNPSEIAQVEKIQAQLADLVQQTVPVGIDPPPDARFSETAPRENSQTLGEVNTLTLKDTVSFKAAEAVIKEEFNWETLPLDVKGQQRALEFLHDLTSGEKIAELQDTLQSRLDITAGQATIAAGIARASYFAYTSRLFNEGDAKAARNMIAKGFHLANDVRAQIFGAVDASTIGRLLASERAIAEGSISGVFATDIQSRYNFVREKFGKDGDAIVARAKEIDSRDNQLQEADREDIADAATLPTEFLKAEEQQRKAWAALAQTVQTLAASGVQFSATDGNISPETQAWLNAVLNGANLSEISDLFEAVAPKLNEAQQATASKVSADAKKLEKRREALTKRTRSKNPLDIAGKRFAGAVERSINQTKVQQSDAKDTLKGLLDQDLSQSAFVEAYVAAGGTQDVAADVYGAAKKRTAKQNERALAREEAAEQREQTKAQKKLETIEKRAQKFVDSIGVPREASTTGDTPGKAVQDFIFERATEADLRTRLAAVPGFTQERVDAAVSNATDLRSERGTAQQERDAEALSRPKRAAARFEPAKGADRSLAQVVKEDIVDSGIVTLLNHDEKVAFAKDLLKKRFPDLPDSKINAISSRTVAALEERLVSAKLRVANDVLKGLKKGQLDDALIEKAVRLQVLDPSNDFITSIAAIAGWEGLSDADLIRTQELEKQKQQLDPTSAVYMSKAYKQARIINASSGLQPKMKDYVNSVIRAGMYSALTSQTVGIVAGSAQILWLNSSELARNIGDKRGRQTLGRSFVGGAKAATTEFQHAFLSNVTAAEQLDLGAETSTAGKRARPKGGVNVATLIRTADIAGRRVEKIKREIADTKTTTPKKAALQAKRLVLNLKQFIDHLGQATFKSLGAVDAAVTKQYVTQQTAMLTHRDAKQLKGNTKKEYDRVVQQTIVSGIPSMKVLLDAGLTPLEAKIEIQHRTEGAIFEDLQKLGLQPAERRRQAIADIQAKIGTGQRFSNSYLGRIGSSLATAANFTPGGAAFLPAISTVSKLYDNLAWSSPIGLVRRRNFLPSNGRFGSKKSLDQLTEIYPDITADHQVRRRELQAYFGSVAVASLVALMWQEQDKPDDEKIFYFSGPWSPDMPDGDKENTLYVNVGDERVAFELTRGAFESLFLPFYMSDMLVSLMKGFPKDAEADKRGAWENYLTGEVADAAWDLSLEMSAGPERLNSLFTDINRKGPGSVVISGASKAVPLNGLVKSVARITGKRPRIDRSRSGADQINIGNRLLSTFWVDTEGEHAIVQEKSFLGENLNADVTSATNPISRTLSRIGFPIYRTWQEEDRDPRKKAITEEFFRRGYDPNGVQDATIEKKFEASGKDLTNEAFVQFQNTSSEVLTDLYTENIESLHDPDLPDAAYKKAVKGLYESAKAQAYAEQGVSFTK